MVVLLMVVLLMVVLLMVVLLVVVLLVAKEHALLVVVAVVRLGAVSSSRRGRTHLATAATRRLECPQVPPVAWR